MFKYDTSSFYFNAYTIKIGWDLKSMGYLEEQICLKVCGIIVKTGALLIHKREHFKQMIQGGIKCAIQPTMT